MSQPGLDLKCLLGRRPRVVIGHPFLGRGGSEANVMWLAEALKPDCDLTVMTTGGWDLTDLNQYYGTSLKPGEVTVLLAPTPPLPARANAAALRGAFFQRFARRIAPEYDVRISAYNPTDWGLPAIHFIADFSWHRQIRESYNLQAPGLIYRDTLLRRIYLLLARTCSSPSRRNPVLADRLVANSEWSATQLRRYYPLSAIPVTYPPVWASFSPVPWLRKEQHFAMLGRVAPEKRVVEAIRIFGALRSRGHQLTLHLCGSIPPDDYGRTIDALCDANRDWIMREGLVSDVQKADLLSRCRYGIQMCACEAFGISAAEMIKAGMIVFAPNDGGQVEILNHPDLLFANEREAVGKIHAVLELPELQTELRDHLRRRAGMFGVQTFVREVRAHVAEALLCGRAATRAAGQN